MFGLSPIMAAPRVVVDASTRLSWDPAYTTSPLTLESSNTRLVLPTGNSAVAKTSRSVAVTGKKYMEFVIIDVIDGKGTTTGVGIADSSHPFASANLSTGSAAAANVGLWASGRIYKGGGYTEDAGLAYGDGDRIMVAVDRVSGLIYFGKNGTWPAGVSPSTNSGAQQTISTTGTMYVACSPWSSLSGTVKIEVARGAGLLYSIPAGFTSI